MSNSDDVDKVILNSRDILNLPTHGSVPKWLEDISQNVIQSRCSSGNIQTERVYNIVDFNSFKSNSNIPSRLPLGEGSAMEKANTRPSSRSAKFGRRASLATQILAQTSPKHVTVSKSEYLVPKLDGKVDFTVFDSDSQQADLEKSWRSLTTFQQTHKGRLDSANNSQTFLSNTMENHEPTLSRVSSLSTSTSENDASDSYSPSFVKTHAKTRSKSELSNYMPYYVFANIKKATEPDPSDTGKLTSFFPTTDNSAMVKSKSTENIFDYLPNQYFASYKLFQSGNGNNPSSIFPRQKLDLKFKNDEQSTVTVVNQYKKKVAEENMLRQKIINELLAENERITEKLKHKVRVGNENCGKLLRTPSFEDVSLQKKMYNKNLKYKTIHPVRRSAINRRKTSLEENRSSYFNDDDAMFVIPVLPTGRMLIFDIISTWGDKHYVGLNGIEIFGSNGKIVGVKKISASPPDVNILPENYNDPRIIKNLLDGVNRTQDDVHLWLAPFDPGYKHTIFIEFHNDTTLAMLRIWNYNKSRIHSYRGVKDVIVTLDDIPIFKGEIAKACGGILGGVDAFGDTILFTIDEEILELISQNDHSYSTLTSNSKAETPTTTDRPPTVATANDRPYTGAPNNTTAINAGAIESITCLEDQILLGATRVDLVLLSNWGYPDLIGLTGFELVGASDATVQITAENLRCISRFKSIDISKLVNGENVTTDTESMWFCGYKPGEETTISVILENFTFMSGIRLWNYNNNLEGTYAGMRTIKILLDDKPLINPLTGGSVFLLRRAPGNIHYDFVQDICFTDRVVSNTGCHPNFNTTFSSLSLYKDEIYENPTMPEGFVFQFIIFSTWGDQYYCGLNGIELYNQFGKKIALEEQNICAYPESINVLPGVCGDVRTPDKLIDNVVEDHNAAHSWLAPIIPKCLNRIYLVLDQPTIISLIKIWNYSKAPSRGVKEFGILVDDLLVYNGILDKYSNKQATNYCTVLFTDYKHILERENDTFIRHSSYGHEVLLSNENRTTTGGSLPNPDQTLRPFTSVSPFDRGYISH